MREGRKETDRVSFEEYIGLKTIDRSGCYDQWWVIHNKKNKIVEDQEIKVHIYRM